MMGYLEKLEFSKDWTKAEDFPTYEPDESQVRADLQLLHNEAKAAINALVDKLESAEFASHLAVSAEGMTATNLAAALAVFAVIGVALLYALDKIKKDNIIETLKRDDI